MAIYGKEPHPSQIAGTARSRGYSLATLNTSDFRDLDLSVLEPR